MTSDKLFQWLLLVYRWIDDNKQLLNTGLLLLIAVWLSFERGRLKDLVYQLRTLRQEVRAVQTEVESSPTSAGVPPGNDAGSVDAWDQIRNTWTNVRDRIERKIEQLDGRVRRKYENIARYNYANVIQQLHKDEELGEGARDALVKMNDLFLKFRRNPRRATKEEAERFNRMFDSASSELP